MLTVASFLENALSPITEPGRHMVKPSPAPTEWQSQNAQLPFRKIPCYQVKNNRHHV